MKTAIYNEDGVIQLVLTPESEFEKKAIDLFADKKLDIKIFDGSFYDCRGGWVRQNEYYPRHTPYGENRTERSIIIMLDARVLAIKTG